MAVVGGREAEAGTVQVRNRAGEQSTEPLEDFAQRVAAEIAERRR
jgi:threonyl-tRNA synthetase